MFGVVIVVMMSAGSTHAFTRSWRFVNPSFNPNSLAGNYLQFTADASGGGGEPDFEMPDIEGALDNAFRNVDNLFFDIQSGIGNIGIDFPGIPSPEVPETPDIPSAP